MDGEDCCSRVLVMVEYTDYDPIIYTENDGQIHNTSVGVGVGVDVDAKGMITKGETLVRSDGMNHRHDEQQTDQIVDDSNQHNGRIEIGGHEGKATIKAEKVGETEESEIKQREEEEHAKMEASFSSSSSSSSSSSHSSSSFYPSSSSFSSSSSFCPSSSFSSSSSFSNSSLNNFEFKITPLSQFSNIPTDSNSSVQSLPKSDSLSKTFSTLLSDPITPLLLQATTCPQREAFHDPLQREAFHDPGRGGHPYSGPGGHYLGACLCSPRGCQKSNNTFKKTLNNRNSFFHPTMPCGGTYVRAILPYIIH